MSTFTSTIPGGITVSPDTRGAELYGELPLRDLVAQVINALTFEGTHEATADQRCVPQGSAGDIDKLRDEQRQRVNAKYSGMNQPTPDHVQRELLFLYRGEASSVDLAKESQGREKSVIDITTEDSVRILKKEMKQKIHEWEGSFKQANGREAGPQDKATLRPVYEVYKVAKNRITPPVAPTAEGTAGQPASTPAPATTRASTSSALAGGVHPPAQPSQPPGISSGRPSSAVSSAGSAAGGGSSSSAAPPASAGGGAGTASSGSATAAGHASSNSNLPLARRISLDEAALEKRKLKRKLHQFESEFERKHGRAPQREDRREYSSEYARYAELKAMLNER